LMNEPPHIHPFRFKTKGRDIDDVLIIHSSL